MNRQAFAILAALMLLAGCGARDEYPHETVAAYQADKALREALLQKCADHILGKMPFRTAADTEECRKAASADANIRFAAHEARERQGWSDLSGKGAGKTPAQ